MDVIIGRALALGRSAGGVTGIDCAAGTLPPRSTKTTGIGTMKTISFAIPCYNSAAYMDKCIESILKCGDDIEIIIVDDGSTKDETPAKADAWAAKYPDIIRAVHQENGGHGQAVNTGLANATGATSRWSIPTTGSTSTPCRRSWATCASSASWKTPLTW